jgi:N-acetylneuraminic acid mutarotase
MGGFIGGKLYATGGPSGALLAYDPATGDWETKASLPGMRWSAAGVALAGKLYILGGFEGERGAPRQVRKTSVYDSATNNWTTRRQLPSARFDLTASRVVVDGQPRIQAVGGPRPGNNLQFIP